MQELKLWQEVQEDLNIVETELLRQVKTSDPILNMAAQQLVEAGGKRLRPAFAILSAKCCGATLDKVLPLAVALEIIHMATLVHDDIIDLSPVRRGRPTVWVRWGQDLSLHAGDYLFARSLALVAVYDNPDVSSTLAAVSVKMVQGEMQQLYTAYNINITLREYLDRIFRKTAFLIAASCKLGAIVAGASKTNVKHFYNYGRYLGMAFQITDDVLDIVADPAYLGKPIGSDLRQGIITLPAIYALKYSPVKERIARLLAKRDKTTSEIEETLTMIHESGGIDYSLNLAERYLSLARKQVASLPEGLPKDTLIGLTHYVRTRGL